MNRRHVLLLTYHYPPSAASGSFRLLGFSRYLPRLGWRVSVVAPPQLPGEPVDPGLAARIPSEVDVESVPYPATVWKPIRILFPFGVWLPAARAAVARVLRRARPDVVVTSGPPHVIHLLGLWLKRRHGVPWVADFRDPWVKDGLGRPPRRLDRWFLFCERQVYTHADRIIANAPNARDVYAREYPRHSGKIRMVTNGFDPGVVDAPPRARRAGTVRLVYAGELYLGRDPLPLLDAMREVERDPPVPGTRLVLDVLGRAERGRDALDRAIAERGLQDAITFRGHVPYDEAARETYAADINVLFDTPNRTFGVPAKLYEYFGAARPVLALAEAGGDTANVLRAAGLLHRIASPRDAGEIRAALAGLVKAVIDGDPVVQDTAAIARFTREHLTRSLSGILEEVLASDGGAAVGKERVE